NIGQNGIHSFQNLHCLGIISSFAFNPMMPGMFVAGCYDKSVGVYDERRSRIVTNIRGHKGGVTHVKFSSSGNYFFSGARKDDKIYCWDIRNYQCVFSLDRVVKSNQRVVFDLDSISKYLITGSEGGQILVYDLSKNGEEM